MGSRVVRALWRSSLIVAVAALPVLALAQTSLIFERTRIQIESPPRTDAEKTKKPPHVSLAYDIELRAEEALRLEYIHTLNTLSDSTGVMIALQNPGIINIPAMKVYTPVDVLFLDEIGTIQQIIPKLTLGELTQTVQSRAPVKSILFLQAGEVARRGIRPQDIAIGAMFVSPPDIQE